MSVISHISDYLEQKRSEKIELEQQIIGLRKEVEIARAAVENARSEKNSLLADMNSFHEAKNKIENIGVPVDDLSRLAKAFQGFIKYDYNVERVIGLLANLDSAFSIESALESQIRSSSSFLANLKEECNYWNKITK